MKKDRPEVWNAKTDIIYLYEKGYTLRDLGKKYKCNDLLIKQILNQNDIKIRNKSDNTRMKSNNIIDLYKQGYTLTEIQKKTHTNFNIVKEIINKFICQ